MGDLNFSWGALPYTTSLTDAPADIAESSFTGGLGGSWFAEKFIPNQDITVNRIAFILGAIGGVLNPSYFVGITTSLGPNGLYPYTSDGIAGSAGSLGFISSVITTRFTASESYFALALPSNLTLNRGVTYWLCNQTISRVSGGTFTFLAKSNVTRGSSTGSASVRQNAGTFTISDIEDAIIVGYDSGAGNTVWYPKGPYVGDDIYFNTFGPAYYEFGAKFELNDFTTQELFLDAVTYGNLRPVDSNTKYTCRLYDQQDSVVGIAITEQAFIPSGGAATDAGNFVWYFIPPVRVLPNYEYKIGIVATGNTAAGQHRRFFRTGGNEYNDGSLVSYFDFVERSSSSSGFATSTSTDGEKYKANIYLNFKTSTKMRRGQGN